jgi:molybdate transport system permease protein
MFQTFSLLLLLGLAPGADVVASRTQFQEELRVWAAASLGPVLGELRTPWEEATGASLVLNLDASSRISVQVAEGAPADVLLTADRAWMDWAVARGVADASGALRLAGNQLVLVAPAAIGSVESAPRDRIPDLSTFLSGQDPSLRIGIAGEEVPAGRYARESLQALGLTAELGGALVTGGNVRTVLEWVARGELPLGFVYRSDAFGDPRVRVVAEVPDSLHTPVEIWGAPVIRGDSPSLAAEFLDFLMGVEGQAALRVAGFVPRTGLASRASAGGFPVHAAAGVSVWSAILISIQVALVATVLAMIPAVGLGWLLARRPFPGKTLVSALLLAPLVIPPVVTGFLLLSLLGRGSPLGQVLEAAGVTVPFSFLAAVTAAAVVGFPLFVITVRNAFEAVDSRLEEMSWTLGARPRRTFWRVSLPLALPGIGAGAVLAFARALGEFGATVVLAGNVEGETRTIALAVYTLLESPGESAAIWWLVGASVAISLLALAGFEYLSRRQRHLVRRNPDV